MHPEAKLTINSLRRLLFGLLGRSEKQFQLASGKLLYIAGALSVDLDKVSEFVSAESYCKCWVIETSFYLGRYISLDDQSSILIIKPIENRITLGPEEFNQSIEGQLTEELLAIARENNIEDLQHIHFGIFWGLFEVYLSFLCHYFNLSVDQLHEIKMINTYTHFGCWYNKIVNGQYPGNLLYIDIFVKQYYLEVQIISKLFKGNNSIVVHDAGTSSANFPVLLNMLDTHGHLPFSLSQIECSDFNIQPVIQKLELISKRFEHKHSIKSTRIDLKGNYLRLNGVDVVVVNDVLEHFEEKDSFNVLLNLWNHISDLLIVHVPIEENLAHHFGHLTYFTREKLDDWANRLPFCENLTDALLNDYKNDFFVDGFLVLRKQKVFNE